mmetsp:Transcript_19995/g.48038  ORF Transcript_19995/g.48038 Transcript_19995/m.48038 type:complete len:305 (+) Transcript_19995:71-985(+)|eukprot:CAMPEP_0181100424 /NCGR_PEP_ID=MMETSP1071-20121207/13187_1 /TAXON_ID=35127 /ORGANISM="Thalassiosira sp., Strain NH16" /LENGTH=304 /DNA_ID=CAMNT_0023183155 /DNA_START=16 /DNA_END=930 /DNA_ORIENTATION=+
MAGGSIFIRAVAAAVLLLNLHDALAFTPASSSRIAPSPSASATATTSSSSSSSSLNLFSFGKKPVVEEKVVVPAAIPGIGDEGCALPSPSGVNTLDEKLQALVFLKIYAALAAGTYLLNAFLGDITLQYEWVQNWRYTWPLLGFVYVLAGATHFTLEKEYVNIYPAKGAWGFWNLPGTPEFHVRWTGVAEILGGLGLLIGGGYDAFAPPYTQFPNVLTPAGIGYDAAAGLFLLTLAVTPANIYMYTHGAKLPMETPDGEVGPEIPVAGHAIRGAMQVVLLALLYQMGDGTFDSIAAGTFGCPTC